MSGEPCEVRYAFDLTLSDGKKKRFVDTQLKPDILHPFNRPEQEYHDHFADTKNYEKAWEKALDEHRRQETAIHQAKEKEDERAKDAMWKGQKNQLKFHYAKIAAQSNISGDLKAMHNVACVLLRAKIEDGNVLGSNPYSSTYRGNNCRLDDRRRTQKSKSTDCDADMIIDSKVLENNGGVSHSRALQLLNAIARDAELNVVRQQDSIPKGETSQAKGKRTTRRAYFIPIRCIRNLRVAAETVKDALELFGDDRRSKEQKEWVSEGRKRKRGVM